MGSEGFQTFLVIVAVPLICGTALWLWHLARNSFYAKLMIIALWLVFLAMSIIIGPPAAVVMGSATVMMALAIWIMIRPRWL